MSRVEDALRAASETQDLLIGSGIISETARVFKEQFPDQKAVVVAHSATYDVAGRQVEQVLKEAGVDVVSAFVFTEPDLYAEYSYIDRLVDFLKTTDAIAVAVGSGTINDLTKLSSSIVGRRYMVVGTAASMDGYTAYGASITKDGAKQTFSCPAPQAMIADTAIISKAPSAMSASGYADLFAKVTAGADWIVSHYLEVEPIDKTSWSIVQDGLHDALAMPEEIKKGNEKAVGDLIQGLVLGGFAMQYARSSRPASGAEHQFSHLWNMEHHTNDGEHISHGFQVSIGMLAVTAMYEEVLKTDFTKLDVDKCCSLWPTLDESDKVATEMFVGTDFPTIGVTETRAKYVTKEKLRDQLILLKKVWPELKKALEKQLVPFDEVKRRLKAVGAPTEPEEIGISRERLRSSFIRAQYIRRRFTVLDLAVRTCMMQKWLDAIFGNGGVWHLEK